MIAVSLLGCSSHKNNNEKHILNKPILSQKAKKHIMIASELIKSKRFNEALEEYKKAQILSPNAKDILQGMLILNHHLGFYKISLEGCQKLLIQHKTSKLALYYQALNYRALNMHNDAIKCLEKLLKQKHDMAIAYKLMATSYQKLNKPAKALEVYKKLAVLSKDTKVYLLLADLAYEMGKFDIAQYYYEVLIKNKNKTSGMMYYKLAKIYLRDQNIKKAKDMHVKVVSLLGKENFLAKLLQGEIRLKSEIEAKTNVKHQNLGIIRNIKKLKTRKAFLLAITKLARENRYELIEEIKRLGLFEKFTK